MDRYVAMKTNVDGTRMRVGGIYENREQAERAVQEIRKASSNTWAVEVARHEKPTNW